MPTFNFRERAIEDYDKAIKLDPNSAGAYNNRGLSYRNLGQYQRALNDDDSDTARRELNYTENATWLCSWRRSFISVAIR